MALQVMLQQLIDAEATMFIGARSAGAGSGRLRRLRELLEDAVAEGWQIVR
jgi:hypothetical protein